MITGSGDIPLAVEAMRRGADHFAAKPIEPMAVAAFLRRTLDMGAQRPSETRRGSDDALSFFGSSTSARELRQLAEVAASSDSVVLITGETGSGKGVLARWIHEQSARRAKRLVEVVKAVDQIARVSQQNVAATDQLSKATIGLAREAERMRTLAQAFAI